MKVRDTSRGRMYALSSEIGCTAINGAMAVDIPAGGQSVVLALDKKLIIAGDDNAKFVEVRWGTNAAIGSRPSPSWMGDILDGLVSIVGADKFDVNYIPGENKLYLIFSLDTTSAQIEEVKSLCARVLPSNVVTEIDEIPLTYTRLEYLECTLTQYIDTGIKLSSESEVESQYIAFDDGDETNPNYYLFASRDLYNKDAFDYMAFYRPWGLAVAYCGGDGTSPRSSGYNIDVTALNTVHIIKQNVNYIKVDDLVCSYNSDVTPSFECLYNCLLCGKYGGPTGRNLVGRVYAFSISRNNQLQLNFIPALDSTGTPCMLDTVTRKPFYNDGTGDFLYPGKETEATTYSLRNRMYAQYTEHGIRRLYRVPDGYNSKEEYAEENGFKLLVETPMPEEGYWTPVWHDREDCIELEWVETEEPPTEEELQIEEIENA